MGDLRPRRGDPHLSAGSDRATAPAPDRPISPGEVLSRTWRVYRAHAGHLIAVAAAFYVPLAVAGAGLAQLGWPGVVAGNLLGLAAIFIVQGALVSAVWTRRGDGHPGIAGPVRSAGRRAATLVGAGLLAAAGVAAGLLALVVPGLVLLTWWLVLAPVIMIEGLPVRAAFARSRALVRPHAWGVFGVMVLTLLVLLAFSVVLAVALEPLGGVAGGAARTAVGNSVAAPFAAVAWTLTYLRLREAAAPDGAPPAAGRG